MVRLLEDKNVITCTQNATNNVSSCNLLLRHFLCEVFRVYYLLFICLIKIALNLIVVCFSEVGSDKHY